MNPLERILIEKAGREHGFENVLPGQHDAVVLGSARHQVQVNISFDNSVWLLKLPAGQLTHELERSFPRVECNQGQFIAPSIDLLTQLLNRAAALAQSLPNQAEIDYEAEVQKTLAQLPPNGTEIECMVRQRIGQNTFPFSKWPTSSRFVTPSRRYPSNFPLLTWGVAWRFLCIIVNILWQYSYQIGCAAINSSIRRTYCGYLSCL